MSGFLAESLTARGQVTACGQRLRGSGGARAETKKPAAPIGVAGIMQEGLMVVVVAIVVVAIVMVAVAVEIAVMVAILVPAVVVS